MRKIVLFLTIVCLSAMADKLELIGVSVKGTFPIKDYMNAKIKSVSTYINGSFKTYKVGLPDGFQQIKNFEGGRGYWIVLKDDAKSVNFEFTGDEISLNDINVSVDQTLNLVSFPAIGKNFEQIQNYFSELGLKIISISTYLNGSFKTYKYGLPEGFQQIKEIESNKGYWIASQSESVDITPPLPPDFNGTKPSNQ